MVGSAGVPRNEDGEESAGVFERAGEHPRVKSGFIEFTLEHRSRHRDRKVLVAEEDVADEAGEDDRRDHSADGLDRLHDRLEHDLEESADIHRRTEGEGAEDEGDRPVHRLEAAALHKRHDVVRRFDGDLRIDADAVLGEHFCESGRVFRGTRDLGREYGDISVLHDV
ncbi:hypothetical protein SDC9_129651 [bioreactor metagenome]|uniref:Uncharacterized protein n=1 Tax=bioreactor metagenome TaxID=1076179 RepID=A0A645CZF0_9ZZZZ